MDIDVTLTMFGKLHAVMINVGSRLPVGPAMMGWCLISDQVLMLELSAHQTVPP